MATRKNTAPLHRELQDIRLRLEIIHTVILTAVAALEWQAADRDTDIARCLLHCAAEPVSIQLERLAALMGD